MQSTLAPNGQQIIPGTEEYTPEPETKKRRTNRGNSLMRGLTPAMWYEPFQLEDPEQIMSDDFCVDKGEKLLLSAIGFQTEEEWLDYCKRVYAWREDRPRRELNEIAEQQAALYRENPILLELILEKVKPEAEAEATPKAATSSKKS